MSEAELYPPIKKFLEGQGYEVKGEVGACDVVAVRGDDDPVVVELKRRLSLTLILQGVDRLAVTDAVYLAVPEGKRRSRGRRGRSSRVRALLRRVGLGLLTVTEEGRVVPVLDPTPYRPRKNGRRRRRLLKEFAERIGDPEAGGSRAGRRLTAYRQKALRCAEALARSPELKVSAVRERTGVQRAGAILRDNHYGWFARVRRGHYELTARGRRELAEWTAAMEDRP